MPTRYFRLEKIRRGKGARRKFVYADLYEVLGGCPTQDDTYEKQLAIAATLDYILRRIHEDQLNVLNLNYALINNYNVITGTK